ncbi:hypothetical protein K458DRAFT_433770 [Lentithecium fluviatile CBS 122367]|uniref:Inner kinetochore subunit AME1 domain-containing protein n=1 Tax=Lentithecium fluviatile CBS 122367 TaxID=1168545 RepID=A0A6G1ITM2_9PLEO|nr:hypothetical protein K458DRAFT_433770 [Lentithecium fluviatile CBS 122367]
MAPVDRQERRQQRMRGAGASTVLENFGFNFANLAPKTPAAQSSLPPQRSRRTPTPVQKTLRGSNNSTKRHRSASVQRSNSAKPHITPSQRTVTPKLGKRKRGSSRVEPSADDGEPDDLSPDRDDEVHSVEKSRRVVGTVSPIREELDDQPDELSFLEEGASSVRKPGAEAMNTPLVAAAKRVSTGGAREKTPIADRVSNMIVTSTVDYSRRSKSTEPITPGLLPNGRPRLSSASYFGPEFHTPGAANDEEESEDELSPPVNTATPRVMVPKKLAPSVVEDEDDQEMDELSSPPQPASSAKSAQVSSVSAKAKKQPQPRKPATQPTTTPLPARAERPRQIVMDEEDEVQTTPAAAKTRRKKTSLDAPDDAEDADAPDEISPEAERTRQRPPKIVRKEKEVVDVSSGEESDNYEPEVEDISRTRDAQPAPKPKPAKPASGEPPRKRQKFGGPKQAISVMRIKGSTVRGITVADTTRTILEQNIDHRINRMAEKLQSAQHSSRRKQIRAQVNLALSFRESLNEKLLDLQDANDTLSAGFKKRRMLKNGNIERRKEILALQNTRQEIALEMDDEQALFDAEKEKIEARNKLSTNMFDIQAAIQSGRERARQQGREDEGPEMPLSMLLDSVGRDVGSVGGGLLAGLREFNSGLERAAGWLEGRA